VSEKRSPITKAQYLDSLDNTDVLEGYHDGRAGDPEPGDNRSFSYWHGWRNGRIDGGHDKPDAASAALAKDVIESGWLKNIANPKPSEK
jgi:hypothetical protein